MLTAVCGSLGTQPSDAPRASPSHLDLQPLQPFQPHGSTAAGAADFASPLPPPELPLAGPDAATFATPGTYEPHGPPRLELPTDGPAAPGAYAKLLPAAPDMAHPYEPWFRPPHPGPPGEEGSVNWWDLHAGASWMELPPGQGGGLQVPGHPGLPPALGGYSGGEHQLCPPPAHLLPPPPSISWDRRGRRRWRDPPSPGVRRRRASGGRKVPVVPCRGAGGKRRVVAPTARRRKGGVPAPRG